MRPTLPAVLALVALTSAASAQAPLRGERGSRAAERKTVLEANRVRHTVFNTGLSGGVGEYRGEWPLGSSDFYLGDLMFVVGAEITDDTGARVPVVAVPRGPGNRGIPFDPATGVPWTWEAVPGYAASGIRPETGGPEDRPATSSAPETWPAAWPDRQGDAADPGWAGSWDGLLGKDAFVNGTEIYSHLADDNVRTAAYTPDPADPTRGGLGLVTRQRVLALRDAGFEDGLLYVWDVVNTSPRDLDAVAAGFVAGTLSGGDGDSQDDVAGHDAARGLVYSYDFNGVGNQGQPVGYTGFVVLPTPGGGLDLGGARYVAPSIDFPLRDAGLVWGAMESGGLFPQDACLSSGGCDGDLFLSSAPFALPAFSEKRFAAAVVFGTTLQEVRQRADRFRAFAASGFLFGNAVEGGSPGAAVVLSPATQNPARTRTALRFTLAEAGVVSLRLFDALGRQVAILADGLHSTGEHTVTVDTGRLGPGLYVVRLDSGATSMTQRFVVVR